MINSYDPKIKHMENNIPSFKTKIKIIIIAGVGGIMPTLCRLASAFATNPDQSLRSGTVLAIILFFIIGASICAGFQEWRHREAFMLGICGPALIMNIVAGFAEGINTKLPNSSIRSSFIISNSYAQTLDEKIMMNYNQKILFGMISYGA